MISLQRMLAVVHVDHERYEPTPEDWADYEAAMEAEDRRAAAEAWLAEDRAETMARWLIEDAMGCMHDTPDDREWAEASWAERAAHLMMGER